MSGRNLHGEAHAAALLRAASLRFLHRYSQLRSQVEHHGGYMGDFPDVPYGRCDDSYRAVLKSWLHEPITCAAAARSATQLAGVIALDKLTEGLINEGRIVMPADDAAHQVILLTAVSGWLNDRCNEEWIAAERAMRERETA